MVEVTAAGSHAGEIASLLAPASSRRPPHAGLLAAQLGRYGRAHLEQRPIRVDKLVMTQSASLPP